MTPFWGADEAVSRWVAARIPGGARGFGACRALGVADGRGEIVAGVVFHDWSPEAGSIELSAAASDRRWLTREAIRATFGYAFAVARIVVTRTTEGNAPVRRIWRALGAAEHVIPDLAGPGVALVIYTLTPAQLAAGRLGGRYGQVERAAAA